MVGLKVDTQNVVSSVVPGSPADVYGVKVGNKIPRITAFEEMGPVIGSSAKVQVQDKNNDEASTNVELVATDPTLIIKAEETLKAIEGLSRHLGQKGDWDGRVLCSFLRDNTRELLRICYGTYKPAQQATAKARAASGGEKGPDLIEKVQLLEVRCAALTEHLQMQQEAIEDYQQRLNRYEKPGGSPAVASPNQGQLAAVERAQYEQAVTALKAELKRSQDEMDAFRASSDRIMKAQEEQVEQLRSRMGGGSGEEAKLREKAATLQRETEALRDAVKKLGDQLVEAKEREHRAGRRDQELETARAEAARAKEDAARALEGQRMAEKMAEEYSKVPVGSGKQGAEEKRVMLAKVSLMEQAMGSCIDKMKQRQEEMEEDKEEYRRQMQARMQEMEYAAKQRLDNLEREKLALEAKLDALVQQQPGQQAEQKQLRQLQEHSFALEERLRDALDDADRAQRDRESMRRELDQAMRAMRDEVAERTRETEEKLAQARVRIDVLEEEERLRQQEQVKHLSTVKQTTEEAFAAMTRDIQKLLREKEELRAQADAAISAREDEVYKSKDLRQQLAGQQTVIKRGLEEREKSKTLAASLQQKVDALEREAVQRTRQLGLLTQQRTALSDDLAVAERKAAAASSGGGKLVEGERRSLMEALLSTLPNNSKHLGLPCYPDGLAPAPNGTKASGDLGVVLGREGARIGEEEEEGKVLVRAMNPNGPAAESGLLAVGDEVVTIDGEVASRLAPHQIEAKTSGETGTPVSLLVLAGSPRTHKRVLLVMQ